MPLAESGDKAALQVFETCGRYLGIGIVNVANLFDISEVVVSASFDVSLYSQECAVRAGCQEDEHHTQRGENQRRIIGRKRVRPGWMPPGPG